MSLVVQGKNAANKKGQSLLKAQIALQSKNVRERSGICKVRDK